MSPSGETIGQRIQTVRGDVLQPEFAARLGVSTNTIGRYERDERQPDAEFLLKLCQMGFSGHWLLTGEGSMKPADGMPAQPDPVDLALMEIVIGTVMAWLAAQRLSLRPERVAQLCTAVFRIVDQERQRRPFVDNGQAEEAVSSTVAVLSRSFS